VMDGVVGGVRPVSEPSQGKPAASRDLEKREKSVERHDDVSISPEARKAAQIARLVAMTKQLPDIRDGRVEEARENLERGRHNDEAVIRETAQRLLDESL